MLRGMSEISEEDLDLPEDALWCLSGADSRGPSSLASWGNAARQGTDTPVKGAATDDPFKELAEVVAEKVITGLTPSLDRLRSGQAALAFDMKELLKQVQSPPGPPSLPVVQKMSSAASVASRDSVSSTTAGSAPVLARSSSLRGRRASEGSTGTDGPKKVHWMGHVLSNSSNMGDSKAKSPPSRSKEIAMLGTLSTASRSSRDGDSVVSKKSTESMTSRKSNEDGSPPRPGDSFSSWRSGRSGQVSVRSPSSTAAAAAAAAAAAKGAAAATSPSTSEGSEDAAALAKSPLRRFRQAMSAVANSARRRLFRSATTNGLPQLPNRPNTSTSYPDRKGARFFTSPAAVLREQSGILPDDKPRSRSWAWSSTDDSNAFSFANLDMAGLDALNTNRIFQRVGIGDNGGGKRDSPPGVRRAPPPSREESDDESSEGSDGGRVMPRRSSSDPGGGSRGRTAHRNNRASHTRSFTRSPSSNGKLHHMEGVRQQAELIVMSSTSFFRRLARTDEMEGVRLAKMVLTAWSIVPSPVLPRWCRLLVPLLSLTTVAHSVALSGLEPTLLYSHLSTTALAIGAFCGLLSLRDVQSLLGPAANPLEQHAFEHNFLAKWEKATGYRIGMVLILWVFSVLTDVLRLLLAILLHRPAVQLHEELIARGSFAFLSGLFSVVMYCKLHILTGLELMIDNYCIEFFLSPDFASAVAAWNVLQAILRRAAGAIDTCFLIVQTAATVAFLLHCGRLLDTSLRFTRESDGESTSLETIGFQVLEFLPTFFVALCAVAVFTKASAVTEKCSRVPSLINSLAFEGEELSTERQYLVQYIMHSNAGFYVKGVRLTASMVIKLSYGCGAVVFGLATTLLSSSRVV